MQLPFAMVEPIAENKSEIGAKLFSRYQECSRPDWLRNAYNMHKIINDNDGFQ